MSKLSGFKSLLGRSSKNAQDVLPSADASDPNGPEFLVRDFLTTPTELEDKRLVLRPGDTLGDRFHISAFLGKGGMGEVYAAEDSLLQTIVAIKVIRATLVNSSEARARLIREVKTARSVTHPNLCRIYDIQECLLNGMDILFLTMELLSGETLEERLDRSPKLSPSEAVIVATQLSDALGALHQAGNIHRDFKPSNVILSKGDTGLQAVVLDFGLAHPATNNRNEFKITESGRFVGTPAYMAPEQFLGGPASTTADVYALGIVVAQVITGLDIDSLIEQPHSGPRLSTHARILLAHAGRAWNDWTLRCLEPDPIKRYASAADASRNLPEAPPFAMRTTGYRALRWSSIPLSVVFMGAAFMNYVNWQRPLPIDRHVAILPFHQTTGEPVEAGSLDGLAATLYEDLANCCTSKVAYFIPVSESRVLGPDALKKTHDSLGVNLVLSGTVREDRGRVVVSLQIIDAVSLKTVRTITLRIRSEEIAESGDILAGRVAHELGLLPTGGTRAISISGVSAALKNRQRALAYTQNNNNDDSRCSLTPLLLRQATEADKNYAPAYVDLSRALTDCYPSTRNALFLNQAEQALVSARSLQGLTVPILRAQARLHEVRGNLQGAIEALSQAAALDGENVDVLRELAEDQEDAGHTSLAEATYHKAIDVRPSDWKLCASLGHFLVAQSRYAEAELWYRRADDLAPDNVQAVSFLGGLLFYVGKYTEARKILEHAASIRPSWQDYSHKEWSLFSNLGWAFFYDGRLTNALAAFDQATLLAPEDHRAWRNRGDGYLRMEVFGEARDSYRKALQLVETQITSGSASGSLLSYQALYLSKCGRCAEAVTRVRALHSTSEDAKALQNLAVALEICQHRQEAIRMLDAAFRKGLSKQDVLITYELKPLIEASHFMGFAAKYH